MQVVEALPSQRDTTRYISTETRTQLNSKHSINPCITTTITSDKKYLQKETVVVRLNPEQSMDTQNMQECNHVLCSQSSYLEYLQEEVSSNPYVKEVGVKRSFGKNDKLENLEEFSLVTLSQNCFFDYLQTETSSDAFDESTCGQLESKEYFNVLKLSSNSHPQNSIEFHTSSAQIHMPTLQRTEGSALGSGEDCRQPTYKGLRENQTAESSMHENREDYAFLQPNYESVHESIKETRMSNIQTTEKNIAENRYNCGNITEIRIYDNQKTESSVFESRKGYTLLQMSYNHHTESIIEIQKSNTQISDSNILENGEEHSLVKLSYGRHPKNITEIQISSTQKAESIVDEHGENCALPITSYQSVLENLKESHTPDNQTTVAKYDKRILKENCNFDIAIADLQSNPCQRRKLRNAEEFGLLSNNGCLALIKQLSKLLKKIISQHTKGQAEKRAGVVVNEGKFEHEGGLQKEIKVSGYKEILEKLVSKRDGKQRVLVERVNETKTGVQKIKNSETTAASRRTSLRESVSLLAMNEI